MPPLAGDDGPGFLTYTVDDADPAARMVRELIRFRYMADDAVPGGR